jgi:Phage major capsid protein E
MAFITNINGVSLELLEVRQLQILNENYKTTSNWLIDTFFNRERFNVGSSVNLSSIEKNYSIAAYSNCKVEGEVIASNGLAVVKSVETPYLKIKDTATSCSVQDAALFNNLKSNGIISGNRTFTDDLRIAQLEMYDGLTGAIKNRINLQAAEVLLYGKINIISKNVPAREISFDRPLNATFAPAIPWDVNGNSAKPVQDIGEMIRRYSKITGKPPSKILTTSRVWGELARHQDFNDRFVNPYAGISVPFEYKFDKNLDEGMLRGMIDGIEIWTFDAEYEQKDEVTGITSIKRFVPEGYFGLIGGEQGAVTYSTIPNINSGNPLVKYLTTQQTSFDPAGVTLMVESCPLVTPGRFQMTVGGVGFITI